METISPTLTAARSTKTSAIGMEWEAGSNHERTDDLGSHQPAVVIIGAGFAGLEAARALAHAQVRVTVVDKKNHHCFQPLLYQVATAALSPADVAWPIRSIRAGQRNATVVMADVSSVDTVARTVSTSDGFRLAFDYLIIATGVSSSYFSHPEWAEYAPGLKTIEDATRIRARILLAFERAERESLQRGEARPMSFVVVGGGPTGVELAGSIVDIARNVLAGDFRKINSAAAKVILVEAGPKLLQAFPEELSRYAGEALSAMGVQVITRTAVTACDAKGVSLSNGMRIDSECVVWAAGVKASPAANWLGLQGDAVGRIPVDEFLRVQGSRRIFVAGDIAAAKSGGKSVPGLAPAAKQMGRYIGNYISEDVLGEGHRIKPFVYHHQGDLATIGRKTAVVSRGRLKLRGLLGWIFWSAAHIYFLIGVRNRAVVAINWAVGISHIPTRRPPDQLTMR